MREAEFNAFAGIQVSKKEMRALDEMMSAMDLTSGKHPITPKCLYMQIVRKPFA